MSRLVLSIAVDNAPTGKALGIKEAIADRKSTRLNSSHWS